MRGKRLSPEWRATLAICTVIMLVTTTCVATENVLHNFNDNGKDGYSPLAGLIFDASDNLYGTTYEGGAFGFGTVFELEPKAGGGWTEKILHSFNDSDGAYPVGGLIFDAFGNLYGTTYEGGASGVGTVFELTPIAGGGWTETVLHSFNGNGEDGAYPVASLILDASGNLYGTTSGFGVFGLGTVFELTPQTGGGWKETVLLSFNNHGGAYPAASLILDASGNLYGTTYEGGTFGVGTAFELRPQTGGGWKEKVLHNFKNNGKDGYYPEAGMVFDATGNLYGTTYGGGAHNLGTVFRLASKTSGGWAEKILHNFNDNGKDGAYPVADLIIDASGNLYGTTYGGAFGVGTAFELTPKAGGGWTEKILHSFNVNGKDGNHPQASLVFDAAGNLYGTTYDGGVYGDGTAFEITP